MSDRTRVGLAALLAAGALGGWLDWLVRADPWGVNVLLITAGLAAAVVGVAAWARVPLLGEGRWLIPASLVFASLVAWRSSPTLNALALLSVLTCLALVAGRARAGSLRRASLSGLATDAAWTGLHALGGVLALTCMDIRWDEVPRRKGAAWGAVGRGLLIALPLLLVFGGLFAAADAVFQRGVRRVFFGDFNQVMGHVVLAALCAAVAAGWLRQALVRPAEESTVEVKPEWLGLGTVEVAIVLGALNALFLAFVVIQFRYFFGGNHLVQVTPNLTYAEYARRGFFELVTVAALLLPLLLLADWLHRRERRSHSHLFRWLAAALVVQLFVVIASAFERMRIYQSAYGLTELRVYVTAFMVWLGLLFLWFAATVLRGDRSRFAFGMLATGLLMVLGLHAWNPDARIVAGNLALLRERHRMDEAYVVTLSTDAVPALLAALPALPPDRQKRVAARLLTAFRHLDDSSRDGDESGAGDWRSWNRSRAEALRLLRPKAGELGRLAAGPPPVARGAR